jgi:hypothetical protein
MDERRRKGLCYSCDAKWSRGHVCTVPKLFFIEKIVEQKEVVDMVVVDKGEADPRQFFLDSEPEISLNAITGTPNPNPLNQPHDNNIRLNHLLLNFLKRR